MPLVWFWIKRRIPAGYKLRLVALLVLGGLQGVFGWFMVRSGLSEQVTDVSHFWLSIHLLTALVTLGALVWVALDLLELQRNPSARSARLTGTGAAVFVVLFIQLLLGAWVAGLNAGLASDTWPLMQGRFFPEADWSRGVGWAFTHDPFLLHFLHRWWAWVVVAALVVLARRVRKPERRASVAIHTAFGTQIILGIATVLTGVNLELAAMHQFVGALLVAATAWGAHVLGRRRLARSSGVRSPMKKRPRPPRDSSSMSDWWLAPISCRQCDRSTPGRVKSARTARSASCSRPMPRCSSGRPRAWRQSILTTRPPCSDGRPTPPLRPPPSGSARSPAGIDRYYFTSPQTRGFA